MNIDNGFGAGVFAARVARNAAPATAATRVIGWVDASSGASGDMLLGALVGAGVPLDGAAGRGRRGRPRAGRAARRSRSPATASPPPAATSRSPTPRTHRTWRDVRALLARRRARRRRCATCAHAHLRAARRRRGRGARHRRRTTCTSTRSARSTRSPTWSGSAPGFVHLGLERASSSRRSRSAPARSAARTARCRCRRRRSPSCCAASRRTPAAGAPATELCTPTGAALLTTLRHRRAARSRAMTVDAIGVGAGGRDPDGPRQRAAAAGRRRAEPPAGARRPPAPLLLETNVDDLDPRLWPAVIAALLAAGASDAWLTPILMKKGRPAHTLQRAGRRRPRPPPCAPTIFRQTSTIGLREQPRRQARAGPRDARRSRSTASRSR